MLLDAFGFEFESFINLKLVDEPSVRQTIPLAFGPPLLIDARLIKWDDDDDDEDVDISVDVLPNWDCGFVFLIEKQCRKLRVLLAVVGCGENVFNGEPM